MRLYIVVVCHEYSWPSEYDENGSCIHASGGTRSYGVALETTDKKEAMKVAKEKEWENPSPEDKDLEREEYYSIILEQGSSKCGTKEEQLNRCRELAAKKGYYSN